MSAIFKRIVGDMKVRAVCHFPTKNNQIVQKSKK